MENYKRDPRELPATQGLSGGFCPAPELFGEREAASGGARPATELFTAKRAYYGVVPSRPLFRPSEAATGLLAQFSGLQPAEVRAASRWDALSNTPHLERTVGDLRRTGWFDRLQPGQFAPLGYCIVGGVGLQTGDDHYFLAGIEGSDAADECLEYRPALVRALEEHIDPEVSALFHRRIESGDSLEAALLWLWEHLAWDEPPLKGTVRWPRLLRVAPKAMVRAGGMSAEERQHGIVPGVHFVPFEKGDQSAEDDAGRAIGAAWWRENSIVIDWSRPAVRLLRERAAGQVAHRRPRIQNEDLWGRGGVTWNNVASYLRARLVPEAGVFGHKGITIAPGIDWITWLDAYALLAVLNSPVADFLVRTFLGSRMMIELGDIRRVPIPVLTREQTERLSSLGRQAVLATQRGDRGDQRAAEQAVDALVRSLYGVPQEADLWVVR